LTSLPRGIKVLVLDACSRDHTVQFARGAGAEVVQREWTDFVDARRFALSRVHTPWALMVDADEALDDVLAESIVAAGEEADGFTLRRTTYFCGKPMRLWKDEVLLRLFRPSRVRLEARPAAGGDALLHERWIGDGRIDELRGTLLHYSYPDVWSYRKKYALYTAIEARATAPSVSRLVGAGAGAIARFAYFAVARGALLDGPRGLYVAAHSAAYPAVVAWKSLAGNPSTPPSVV
jgi:glycosyltransferase involved in cell wall biosynthesis